MTDGIPPLWMTLKRVPRAMPYLGVAVGLPRQPDWYAAHALFAPDAAIYPRLAATYTAKHAEATRAYIGMSVFRGAIWNMTAAAVACWLLDRRVPDLSAGKAWLHWNASGYFDALALADPRAWSLSDDPAADHPTLTPLADGGAARARLREQLEAYTAAVSADVNAQSGLGAPALWATTADCAAQAVIDALKHLGRTSEIDAEIAALINLPDSRLNGLAGVVWIDAQRGAQPYLDRAACCLSYIIPAYGYCSTCPLLSTDERRARLHAHAARR